MVFKYLALTLCTEVQSGEHGKCGKIMAIKGKYDQIRVNKAR